MRKIMAGFGSRRARLVESSTKGCRPATPARDRTPSGIAPAESGGVCDAGPLRGGRGRFASTSGVAGRSIGPAAAVAARRESAKRIPDRCITLMTAIDQRRRSSQECHIYSWTSSRFSRPRFSGSQRTGACAAVLLVAVEWTHGARIPSRRRLPPLAFAPTGIQITISYEEPQFVPQPRRAKTCAPLPGGKCEARYENAGFVGRNATMRVCHWPPPGAGSHSAWGCDRQRQKAGRSRRFQGLPFDRGEGRRV